MQFGEQIAQLDSTGARTLTVRATASYPLRGDRLVDDVGAALRALTNSAKHPNIHSRGFQTGDGSNGLHAARREITGQVGGDQPEPRIALEGVHIDARQV